MIVTLASLIKLNALLDAVMLAQHYGPFLGLLILSMIVVDWRDRITDARLAERIRRLEDEIDNAFLPLTKEVSRNAGLSRPVI